jgi:Fur family ferric uptake transcriptional regulator
MNFLKSKKLVGNIFDQNPVDILRSRKLKITPARIAIIEILSAKKSHLSAEEIANRIIEIMPSVHLSTVYRTLDVLEQQGIIEHVHLGHGSAVYHLAFENHRHLLCSLCGLVIEIPHELLDDAAKAIEEKYGFQLEAKHFSLVGICKSCRQGSH